MEARRLTPDAAALVPTAFALAMLGVAYGLRGTPPVAAATMGAAAFLLVGGAALALGLRRSGRRPCLAVVMRKPHYVQALAQSSLWAYWAWHVPEVRAFAPLVLVQLLFSYGFSVLLTWVRRERYELGFGPVPITLSINFFLIFKPEWFGWQFAIIALGYLAKEFIRWDRGGRSAHIFNPSSFPLAVFSVALILMGATDRTLGLEIATTLFYPPHMYVAIFLVALPGQMLFGVATMTISAVLTACAFGVAFQAVTGSYYFFDAYVPIAVFLGMHLLFTDPSTSPRLESGRVAFGVMYGLATIGLAGLLSATGAPTFYDKLIPIPILNLTVRLLDRTFAGGGALGAKAKERASLVTQLFGGKAQDLTALPTDTSLASPMRGLRHRMTTTGGWATAFLLLVLTGTVGDRHEGQWIPFWDDACASGSARACDYLATIGQNFCEEGSGWACNELGTLIAKRATPVTADDEARRAHIAFTRGCELGRPEACQNADALFDAVTMGGEISSALNGPLAIGFVRGPLGEPDLPIVLRGSKGPIRSPNPEQLFGLACELGFPARCG